jgi:hypothetical protein
LTPDQPDTVECPLSCGNFNAPTGRCWAASGLITNTRYARANPHSDPTLSRGCRVPALPATTGRSCGCMWQCRRSRPDDRHCENQTEDTDEFPAAELPRISIGSNGRCFGRTRCGHVARSVRVVGFEGFMVMFSRAGAERVPDPTSCFRNASVNIPPRVGRDEGATPADPLTRPTSSSGELAGLQR